MRARKVQSARQRNRERSSNSLMCGDCYHMYDLLSFNMICACVADNVVPLTSCNLHKGNACLLEAGRVSYVEIGEFKNVEILGVFLDFEGEDLF